MSTTMNTKLLVPLCATVALLAACGRNDDAATAEGAANDTAGEVTTPGTSGDASSGSTVTPVDPAGETSTTPGTTTTPDTPATDPASPPPSGS